VLALVLAEACLVAGLGGLIGLGTVWLWTAGGSPMPGVLPTFYLPPHDLILGIGLVIALGLATGVLPALQAMRLGVAEALRRHV
jgi:putative ABC transport system permease protein